MVTIAEGCCSHPCSPFCPQGFGGKAQGPPPDLCLTPHASLSHSLSQAQQVRSRTGLWDLGRDGRHGLQAECGGLAAASRLPLGLASADALLRL